MAQQQQQQQTEGVSRLQQLESVEKQIAAAIQYAASAVQELSKDKTSLKQVEGHTTNYLKTLEGVENSLSRHISYLTQVATSQPHEGSSYAAQKDLQMAFHRLEHVRSRLNELERMRNEQRLRSPQVGPTTAGRHVTTGESLQRTLSSAMDTSSPGQRSFSSPSTVATNPQS